VSINELLIYSYSYTYLPVAVYVGFEGSLQGNWLRGEIAQVNNDYTAIVYCVDVKEFKRVDFEKIRYIPKRFREWEILLIVAVYMAVTTLMK